MREEFNLDSESRIGRVKYDGEYSNDQLGRYFIAFFNGISYAKSE